MKREIKFRAWVKKSWNNQNWVVNKMFYNVYPNEKHVNINDKSLRFAYNSECELMQYTGLKDKNGVEIYEGDILRTDGSNNDLRLIEDIRTDLDYYGLLDETPERFEIIGNIYQNPELLK